MGAGTIDYEVKDRVATITINRPEAMNALTDDLNFELADTYRQFMADDSAWVAIVRGAGDRVFSVGRDMKERNRVFSENAPLRQGRVAPFVDKPLVAAVQGYALGLGCLEALRCDIRIASETARFGLTETRVGMAAPCEPIIRTLPFSVAIYMLLTGAHVDAQEALRFNLVTHVVPQADLYDRAQAMAETLLANAPLGVRATKANAYFSRFVTPEIGGWYTRMNSEKVMQSTDVREGARAFAEKRRPMWQAR